MRILLALLLTAVAAFAQTSWVFNPHTGKLDAVSIVPSGVPGTWGTIAGTLSNQVDLQGALDLKQPLDADLTAIAALTTTAFGRGLLDDADAPAVRLTLGATTVGANLFTAANPNAIRFVRVNADNSITFLDGPAFLAAIGGGSSVWGAITGTLSNQTDLQSALDGKQPLDTDLLAIAELTTTAFGRGLLDDADASTARGSLGLVIGVNVLAPNGNGSALTGLTFAQLSGLATDAQIPASIARDAEIAAAFQPLDDDLLALAATTGTNTIYYRSATNVWSPVTIGANLSFAGGVLTASGGGGGGTWGTITGTLSSQTDLQTELNARQPLDADLTSLAAISGTGAFYYRSAANTWTPVTIGPNLTFAGGTLSGTGAGGVAWGGISGTLSSQTDLQAALDARQPLDSDLTAIAALSTTTFGRSLLDDANTTAAQATLGLVIGVNVLAPNGDGSGLSGFTDAQIPSTIARDAEVAAAFQPLDSDLTAVAALTTTSFGRSLLTPSDNVAARVLLGLVIGTDVLSPTGSGAGLTGLTDAQIPATIARDSEVAAAYQPLDADLTSLAGISATGSFYYRSASDTWTPVTIGSGLSFAGGTLTATAGGGGTVTATAGALTNNAIVLGAGSTDTKVLASLGTTTTVLHGNAGGAPSFGPVTFSELSGTIFASQVPATLDLAGKTFTGGTHVSKVLTGPSGVVGAITPTFVFSAQNNSANSFFEVLNNSGAGRGALIGMATNNFELWNFQGGPILFYTGATVSTGTVRARIDANGLFTALANLDVSNGSAGSGALTIYEDSDFGTNFTRILVPALAANVTYVLPPDDGNANDRLTSDGSGGLTWAPLGIGSTVQAWDADLDAFAALSGTNTLYYRSASNTWSPVTIGSGLTFTGGTLTATGGGSGTPGGSDTQIQFNDGGAFGGKSTFTFSKTTDTMTIPTVTATTVVSANLEFEGSVADTFETSLTVINPTADRVVALPDANTFIPVFGQVVTFAGPTAARTVTFPDANFTAARTDAANTFTGLQQFTPSGTVAGVNVGSIASDPSAPSNGGIWYESTLNVFRGRVNGANATFLTGGGPLGTPSSATLTNATGLPISTGVSGLGTGVATFLGSPTSDNLRAALTGEVGTGPAMFTRTGVRRTVYVNAGAMIPRTTNGAATTTVETTTNDIMYDGFAFDSTTEEGVGFWWTPPTSYGGGTVTFKPRWTAAAGTGNVKWDFAARAYADDDPLDAALGTEQSTGTDTLLAAGDMHVSPTTPALTPAGTPAANRDIYVQVARDVGTDTLNADAILLGVTVEFTESDTEPSAQ